MTHSFIGIFALFLKKFILENKNFICFIIISFLFCSASFSATYKWVGTESEDWSNLKNWETEQGTTPTIAPDFYRDNMWIQGGCKFYPVYNVDNGSYNPAAIFILTPKIVVSEGATITIKSVNAVKLLGVINGSGSGKIILIAKSVSASGNNVAIGGSQIEIKADEVDLSNMALGDGNSQVTIDCPNITPGRTCNLKITCNKKSLLPGEKIISAFFTVKVESDDKTISITLKDNEYTFTPDIVPKYGNKIKITFETTKVKDCQNAEIEIDVVQFSVQLQKVITIKNNVINPLNDEYATIEINSDKQITVTVFTADGSVIKRLSPVKDGSKQIFQWNGKNESNNVCARGIYFVRVIGNGFEETLKIMLVK